MTGSPPFWMAVKQTLTLREALKKRGSRGKWGAGYHQQSSRMKKSGGSFVSLNVMG